MPKQKLLTYFYILLSVVNAMAVALPTVINRKLVTFFPFPVLILLYLFSIKKVNWWYITSLFATYSGIIFFNTEFSLKAALICYGIGVCIYVILCLKTTTIISIRSIIIATIPFLIVYLGPLFLYYEAVQSDIFNYVMFYVFFVGLFFLIATLIYINERNTANLWLFSSGIVFLISTIIHGYTLFFEYIVVLRICIVFTFLFMHYAMYKYMMTRANIVS